MAERDSVQAAPGVIINAPEGRRVRRLIYLDDPREPDVLVLLEEVKAIRREMSTLRHRLREAARNETEFWFDSTCNEVAGSCTLGIVSLNHLVEGERSLAARADRLRLLWEDIERDPDAYVLRPGTSRAAQELNVARGRIERAARAERNGASASEGES